MYRQDFNIEPLVFWRYRDPPDLRLRGLDSAARYEVTDIDVGPPKIVSGKDLM